MLGLKVASELTSVTYLKIIGSQNNSLPNHHLHTGGPTPDEWRMVIDRCHCDVKPLSHSHFVFCVTMGNLIYKRWRQGG